jgi:hypothetical protein
MNVDSVGVRPAATPTEVRQRAIDAKFFCLDIFSSDESAHSAPVKPSTVLDGPQQALSGEPTAPRAMPRPGTDYSSVAPDNSALVEPSRPLGASTEVRAKEQSISRQ